MNNEPLGPAKIQGRGDIFRRSMSSAAFGGEATLEYFKAAANAIIGDEEAVKNNMENARLKGAAAELSLEGIEGFDEFLDAPTFSGFLDQVVKGSGQSVPFALESIAGALVGGFGYVVGKTALTVGGKGALKHLITDLLKRKTRGETLDAQEETILQASYNAFKGIKFGRDFKVGAGVGAFGVSYPYAVGESAQEFEEAGIELDMDRGLQSFALGFPRAALDLAGEAYLLKITSDLALKQAAKKGSSVLREFGKDLLTQSSRALASEGVIEAAQEGIGVAQRFAIDPTYTKEQALLRLGEAAFMGAAGGLTFGVPSGAVGASAKALRGNAQDISQAVAETTAKSKEKIAAKTRSIIDQARAKSVESAINEEVTGVDSKDLSKVVSEPAADINAQLAEAANFDLGAATGIKRSVWIDDNNFKGFSEEVKSNSKEVDNLGLPTKLAESGYRNTNTQNNIQEITVKDALGNPQRMFAAYVQGTNNGIIVSKSKSIVENVIKTGATEDSLARALGYTGVKPQDATQVVEVVNANENIIFQQAVNNQNIEEAKETAGLKASQNGGTARGHTVRVRDIPEVLNRRQMDLGDNLDDDTGGESQIDEFGRVLTITDPTVLDLDAEGRTVTEVGKGRGYTPLTNYQFSPEQKLGKTLERDIIPLVDDTILNFELAQAVKDNYRKFETFISEGLFKQLESVLQNKKDQNIRDNNYFVLTQSDQLSPINNEAPIKLQESVEVDTSVEIQRQQFIDREVEKTLNLIKKDSEIATKLAYFTSEARTYAETDTPPKGVKATEGAKWLRKKFNEENRERLIKKRPPLRPYNQIERDIENNPDDPALKKERAEYLNYEAAWNKNSQYLAKKKQPFALQDIRGMYIQPPGLDQSSSTLQRMDPFPEIVGTGEIFTNTPLYRITSLGIKLNTKLEEGLFGEGFTQAQKIKAGFVSGFRELALKGYVLTLMNTRYSNIDQFFKEVLKITANWEDKTKTEKEAYKTLKDIEVHTGQNADGIKVTTTLYDILRTTDPIPREARLADAGINAAIDDKINDLVRYTYSDLEEVLDEKVKAISRVIKLDNQYYKLLEAQTPIIDFSTEISDVDLTIKEFEDAKLEQLDNQRKTARDELEVIERIEEYLKTRKNESYEDLRKVLLERADMVVNVDSTTELMTSEFGKDEEIPFIRKRAEQLLKYIELVNNAGSDFAGYTDAETILAGEELFQAALEEDRKNNPEEYKRAEDAVGARSLTSPVDYLRFRERVDKTADELTQEVDATRRAEQWKKATTRAKSSTSVGKPSQVTSIDDSINPSLINFVQKAISKLKLKAKVKIVSLSSLQNNLDKYSFEEPILTNSTRGEKIREKVKDISNVYIDAKKLEESQLSFIDEEGVRREFLPGLLSEEIEESLIQKAGREELTRLKNERDNRPVLDPNQKDLFGFSLEEESKLTKQQKRTLGSLPTVRDLGIEVYDKPSREKRNRVTKEIDFAWGSRLKEDLQKIISDSENTPAQIFNYASNPYERVIVVNDLILGKDPSLEGGKQLTAIAHELGHIFFDEKMETLLNSKLPKDVMMKNRLWQKFQRDRAANPNVAQYQQESAKSSFEEWYADNVASFILDDAKKATDVVGSYFKNIAEALKRFFRQINQFFQNRLFEPPNTVTVEENGKRKVVNTETLIKKKLDESGNFDEIFSNVNAVERDSILFKYHMEQVLNRQIDSRTKTTINTNGKVPGKEDLIQRSIAIDEIQDKVTTTYATKVKKYVEGVQKSGSMKWFNKYFNTVTNWYRSIGGEIGDEIAAFWNPRSQSKERSGLTKQTLGFHRASNQLKNKFVNDLKNATGVDLNNEQDFTKGPVQDAFLLAEDETLDTDKILETVQNNPNIIKRLETLDLSPQELQKEANAIARKAVAIRKFLKESMWENYIEYTDPNDPPNVKRRWFDVGRRKNFAPRIWDWAKVEQNPEALEDIFLEYLDDINTREQAQALVKQYIEAQNENADVTKYSTLELESIPEDWMSNYEALKQYVEENQKLPDPSLEGKWAEAQVTAALNGTLPNQEAVELLEAIPGLLDRFGFSPGMKSALSRKLAKIPTKVLRDQNYLANPALATIQYIHHVTRKVEFEKRGGYAYLDSLVNQLPEDQREAVKDSFRGQLGQWGANMKPWMRNLNSIAALHTVMTTLLFVTISSLTDLGGIITRGKEGSLKGFMNYFSQIGATMSQEDNLKLAEAVGTVSAEALDTLFVSVGELDYANKWARTGMQTWFKWTGLTLYTRFTRILATGMGREFIIESARKYNEAADGSIEKERYQRYLEELGLTPEEANTFKTFVETNDAEAVAKFVAGTLTDSEGKPFGETELSIKIKEALGTFADESIIRPNPGERPTWANHPYAAMVWMLKSYFYSFGTTVLGGMIREGKNRFSEDGHFKNGALLAVLAAGTMLPLAAIGLELRELTKYTLQGLNPFQDASGRTFRSDHMDSAEYMGELTDRSGLWGPWALLIQFVEAFKYGPTEPFTSIVPIVDALDDSLIDGDAMRPWPILNNIQ